MDDFKTYVSDDGVQFLTEDPINGDFFMVQPLLDVTVDGLGWYKTKYDIPEDYWRGTATIDEIRENIRNLYPDRTLSDDDCTRIYNARRRLQDKLVEFGANYYQRGETDASKALYKSMLEDLKEEASITNDDYTLLHSGEVLNNMLGMYSKPADERYRAKLAEMLADEADYLRRVANTRRVHGGNSYYQSLAAESARIHEAEMLKKYGNLYRDYKQPLLTAASDYGTNPYAVSDAQAERNRGMMDFAANTYLNTGRGNYFDRADPYDLEAVNSYIGNARVAAFDSPVYGLMSAAGAGAPVQVLGQGLGMMALGEGTGYVASEVGPALFGGNPYWWGFGGNLLGGIVGHRIGSSIAGSAPVANFLNNATNWFIRRGTDPRLVTYPRTYIPVRGVNPSEAFIWDLAGQTYTGYTQPVVVTRGANFTPGYRVGPDLTPADPAEGTEFVVKRGARVTLDGDRSVVVRKVKRNGRVIVEDESGNRISIKGKDVQRRLTQESEGAPVVEEEVSIRSLSDSEPSLTLEDNGATNASAGTPEPVTKTIQYRGREWLVEDLGDGRFRYIDGENFEHVGTLQQIKGVMDGEMTLAPEDVAPRGPLGPSGSNRASSGKYRKESASMINTVEYKGKMYKVVRTGRNETTLIDPVSNKRIVMSDAKAKAAWERGDFANETYTENFNVYTNADKEALTDPVWGGTHQMTTCKTSRWSSATTTAKGRYDIINNKTIPSWIKPTLLVGGPAALTAIVSRCVFNPKTKTYHDPVFDVDYTEELMDSLHKVIENGYNAITNPGNEYAVPQTNSLDSSLSVGSGQGTNMLEEASDEPGIEEVDNDTIWDDDGSYQLKSMPGYIFTPQ